MSVDPKKYLDFVNQVTSQESKDAVVYDIDDQEFKDIDFSALGKCEIEKASDELNDEDYYYFVI